MDVWQIRPNWREHYQITYALSTEILLSRSGREQRRMLRKTPRKSIAFTATVAADRYQKLVQQIVGLQGPLIGLPEITQGVLSTNAMASAGTGFTVDSIPPWAIPGATAILVSGDRARLRTIATASGGHIVFNEASTNPWPVGTRICPGLTVRLAPSMPVTQITSAVAESQLTFDVDPGSEAARPPTEPALTFNGREVFLEFAANWAQGPDRQFDRTMEVVDYGRGRTATFLPTTFNSQTFPADYMATTVEQANALLDFFLRQRGRQGEFYVPSDLADVTLAANTGNAFLFTDDPDMAAYYGPSTVYKALSFKLKDGTRFFRNVTAITVQGDQSRIQLDQAVPHLIHPADVEVISWMPVLRNASDQLVFDWSTDRVAQVRFNYMTLEALPAE